MRGLLRLLVLLPGLACEGEEVAAVQISDEILAQAPEACQPYGEDAEVFGYCMVDHVSGMKTPEETSAHCALTVDWESRCRHRWVSIQRGDPDTHSSEILLEFCGEDAECAFELLEFRVDPDLATQLGRCTAHTGLHVEDCVGHAIQRWWMGDLSEAELMAGASLAGPYPEKMGFFLAASVACEGVGSCEGAHEAVQMDCERHVENLTRVPENCPSKEKLPMHGDNPENFVDGGSPTSKEGPADESRAPGTAQDPLPPEETRARSPGPEPSAGDPSVTQASLYPSAPQLSPSPSPPPSQPDPGPDPMGGGIPSPDPTTHGHVPDGTPGGGQNPPPPKPPEG